jgi:hypothetical protein
MSNSRAAENLFTRLWLPSVTYTRPALSSAMPPGYPIAPETSPSDPIRQPVAVVQIESLVAPNVCENRPSAGAAPAGAAWTAIATMTAAAKRAPCLSMPSKLGAAPLARNGSAERVGCVPT